MRFSARLAEVKNMLDPVSILVDVGTDHAYLPIKAVSEKLCEEAVAIDNKNGPLLIAKDNIEKAGVSDIVFPLLSEGLIKVRTDYEDNDNPDTYKHSMNESLIISNGYALIRRGTDYAVTIAGMGGENIISILSASPETAHNASKIILEPQKNIDKVKSFLQGNSYQMLEEKNVFSDGKYYTIFAVKYAGM